MKSGYQLTIQRLGHWQLTWDGVDNEDTSWRLVSSWPSYAIPQWKVFISIGPDLRVKKTITLSRRLNAHYQRHSMPHFMPFFSYKRIPSLPRNPLKCSQSCSLSLLLGDRLQKEESLINRKTGAGERGAVLHLKTHSLRVVQKVKIKECEFLNSIKF